MKARRVLYGAAVVAAILGAWLVTNKNCGVALKEELQKRARLDSQRPFVVSIEETMVLPFVFSAIWDYEVPNVESGRAKGWYLFTPWKVYIIRQETM